MILGRINFCIIRATLFTPTYQIWFDRSAILGKYICCILFITFFDADAPFLIGVSYKLYRHT